jgi:type IV pilus assembly protein PilB
MQVDEVGLADFLLSSGALSRRSLDEALREHDGTEPLGHTLVSHGYITDDDLRRAYAGVLGLPFITLAREDIDPAALIAIPEPLARAHNLLGFRRTNEGLDVALLTPEDARALDVLEFEHPVRLHVTTEHSIKHGLLYYQKLLKERFSKLVEQSGHAVEAFLHHALLSQVHGVHIDLSTAGAVVRYRIGAKLHEAMRLPAHVGQALSERLKQLAKLMPTSRSLQEGRFKFEKDGERHVVHLSALPTVQGERLVLRLLREHEGVSGFALPSLGLHGEALEHVHGLLHEREGLILLAGLEGSGKTTAAYTLLDQLPHHTRSVATVEKKIEHHVPHIAQTQIKPQLGLGGAAALRAVLRTNPDIVLVDSLIDEEMALLAARAANMGTLVVAGIEVSSAGAAIEQMRAWGVGPQVFAATLKGAIGVDIVGRLCPHDREDYRLSRAESAPLEPFADFGRTLSSLREEGIVEENTLWKELLFPRATACAECNQGYIGITGVQEVLVVSQTVRDLIQKEAPIGTIVETARGEGMQTLVEEGLFKAAQGITSIEEVFRLAAERS